MARFAAPVAAAAEPLIAVVLAAGRGTRFPEVPSKVLAPLAGRPLVAHVLAAAAFLRPARVVVVVGHARDLVREAVRGFGAEVVDQGEPLGTGHAVLAARPLVGEVPGRLLVLNGDVPLVRPRTLAALVGALDRPEVDAALVSAILDPPHEYGRVLRRGDGAVGAIVEAKDADDAVQRVREINVGLYAFRSPAVFEILAGVEKARSTGEVYLTDAARRIAEAGGRVEAIVLDDAREGLGVNSAAELARVAAAYPLS